MRPEDYLEQDPEQGFEVKFIDEHVGWGLFATKEYAIGDFLLIYRGERKNGIPEKENGYIFDIPHRNEYIDAGNVELSGIARFINDDFVQPNARPYEVVIDSISFIGLKAKRNITVGEEIRYDYLCGRGNAESFPWRSTREPMKIKKPREDVDQGVSCNLDVFHWEVALGGNCKTFPSQYANKKETMSQVRAIDMNSKFVQVGDHVTGLFKLSYHLTFENATYTKRNASLQTYVLETSHKKVQCDIQEMPEATSYSLILECLVDSSEDARREVLLSVNPGEVFTASENNCERRKNETNEENIDERPTKNDNELYSCYYCEKKFSNELSVIQHYLGQQCRRRFDILDKKDVTATICLRFVLFL